MNRRRGMVREGSRGWYASVSVLSPDGRRLRPRAGPFPTRREADEAVTAMLADIGRGTFTSPDRTPLGVYLDEWLGIRMGQVRPTTWLGYRRIIAAYIAPRLGEVPLSKVTAHHLDALYRDLAGRGLSDTSVHHVHAVMRKALADAVRKGYLGRNVALAADPPRAAGPTDITWDATDLARFLAETKGEDLWPVWYFTAMTGCRRGEVIGLRWRDVDLTTGTVVIRSTRVSAGGRVVESTPKTAQGRRSIDIDPGTVAMLKAHRAEQTVVGPDAFVFGPLHPDTVTKEFGRSVRRAGLAPMRFHDLRHLAISVMLQAGVPAHVVSKRAGHANVGFTLSRYASVLPGQDRAAADAMHSAVFGAPLDGQSNGRFRAPARAQGPQVR